MTIRNAKLCEIDEIMEVFDKAEEKMGPGYYTGDGVHPTSAGHELIKREWLKAFETL